MLPKNLFKKPKNDLESYDKYTKSPAPDIPSELCISCPECKAMLFTSELNENLDVCPKCGHHFRVNARQRISMIADEDSFEEHDANMRSRNLIGFPNYDRKLKHAYLESAEKEGVVCGTARINGMKCCLFVMEPYFMMGSMGTVVGEKITRLIEQASVIVGALPYLQAYRDKTFLIKFGGSAMDDARLVKKLMRDIVLLEVLGFNPVIVHGGGKAISKAMAEAGLEARFVNGLRVTTPEAISIVERTLSGTINPGLVQMFRDYGGKGVGIPGTEIFVGERIHEKDEQGNPIDIGEVGNVIGCLTERITEALELQITPIVSPLAKELGTHKPLNVNADLAAAALAKELKPVKLIYISDVPGIMKDPSDPSTLIKSVTRTEALDLIKDGTVSGGMIPKIHSAIDALNAGVRKVHFIDGRLPHTLLLEIFTPDGIGTEIIREQR